MSMSKGLAIKFLIFFFFFFEKITDKDEIETIVTQFLLDCILLCNA